MEAGGRRRIPAAGSGAGKICLAELDAHRYAIAAKRYALYRLDEHGKPHSRSTPLK